MKRIVLSVLVIGLMLCACQFDFYETSSGLYPVYRMNVDGTNSRNISTSVTRLKTQLQLSPDGQYLSYWSWVAPNTFDLYVMNVNDASEKKLLQHSTARWPYWSNDSKHLLLPYWAESDSTNSGIKIID
jgi:Tol biopolymer transport system component